MGKLNGLTITPHKRFLATLGMTEATTYGQLLWLPFRVLPSCSVLTGISTEEGNHKGCPYGCFAVWGGG